MTQLVAKGWLTGSRPRLEARLEAGAPASPTAAEAWTFINGELDQLVDLMEDDRERYMAEAFEQADGIPRYFMQLMALDYGRKPWTMELIRTGLAIGNLVYMFYKSENRARPTVVHLPRPRAFVRAARAIRHFRAAIPFSATSSPCCCSRYRRSLPGSESA